MESTKMTLPELIEVLERFKNEYKESKDPEIRKLCGYLQTVTDKLRMYYVYFEHQKLRIENSQVFWNAALENLKEIVGEANADTEDMSPDLLDLLGE